MLQFRTITGKRDGPHLVISGGVHGDEYEPITTGRRLIGLIDPAQLTGRVTIIPCVNEAAYWRGTRTADDGLDLARVCPGKPDGSITERAAHALSEFIRSADFYIDMHTGGVAYRIIPLAGYTLHRDEKVLQMQRRMARAFNLPYIWGTHPDEEGRSLSVARDANVPAIYTETGGGGSCDQQYIDDCVAGCLNVMADLKMLDREVPAPRVKLTVEDPRPSMGHLQVQHPSPMDGFFEHEVELGQFVEKGQKIGTVVDFLGDRQEPVHAFEAGTVLMLKWQRRVHKNQALMALMKAE